MKIISKMAYGALFVSSIAIISSCTKSKEDEVVTPATPSLYTRLGGTTKVADPVNSGQMIEKGRLSFRSVVDSTVVLIVKDVTVAAPGNMSAHFAPLLTEVGAGNTTKLSMLSKNLTDFFAANTGGAASNMYSGLNMVDAHDPAKHSRMGKKASNADYDKFIGYVGTAAGKNGVTDQAIIKDVVAVLESLRTQIVQAP